MNRIEVNEPAVRTYVLMDLGTLRWPIRHPDKNPMDTWAIESVMNII